MHLNDINTYEEIELLTPAEPSMQEIPIIPINDPPNINEEMEF